MKATEQYFPVVLFITFYKVVLTFESVDEILKCDHSNEIYWEVLSCGAVYYVFKGGSYFWVCGWNHFKSVIIQMKAIEQYFLVAPFVLLCKMVPTFESVDEVVKCAICMKMKAFQQHFNVLLSVS